MDQQLEKMPLAEIFAAANDCYRAGDLVRAENMFRHILERSPNHAAVHFYLAQTLLAGGQYLEGWREMAWRFKVEAGAGRTFNVPAWAGEALSGKTVLVHAEQGFGDNIQFARYVPMLSELGARVIVGCKSGLKRLLTTLPGDAVIIETGDRVGAFDYHAPLMSLPEIFKTTLDTIPSRVPYLSPEPELAKKWAEKFSRDAGFKVGICWSGNPDYPLNPIRSCRFDDFLTLMDIPGVKFYGLQLGEARKQADTFPADRDYQDLSAQLSNDLGAFTEDAAVMANLDLIISTDTAVPHLAGALARPVWCLLSHFADWRWLKDRDDCPWYPTMRLFRQPEAGNWASVFTAVRDALQQTVMK